MKLLFQRILMRISTAQRPELMAALFFFLVFLGLLLGDGKQGLVEVYGVAATLILWVFHVIYNKSKPAPLPRQIFYSWALFVVVAIISTVTSISIGYSFSWVVRLLSGYVVYRLFVDVAPTVNERFFSRCLLALVYAAGALSLGYHIFPGVRAVIPSMNLLSANFGHSHLADLLVFVFPLMLLEVFSARAKLGWGALILYLLMLFSTIARAAWLIVLFYALFVFRSVYKTGLYKKALHIILLLGTAGIFYVGYIGVAARGNTLTKELYTRPRSLDVRMMYWQQAIDGFIDSPILGNGPGTFSLVSLRHQRAPLSSSWFAHSQPLQVLAEMGLVGVAAFGFLIFSHIRFWYRHRAFLYNNPTRRSLLWGVVLVFIYSCFEFVLDYFVVWLLFWAATGFITGSIKEARAGRHDNSAGLAVVAISVFYLFWVAGSSVGIFMKRYDAAFFLAPFDTTQALIYVGGVVQNKHPIGEGLVRVFHKKTPRVLYEVSKQKKDEGDYEAYGYYGKETVFADPQNIEYVTQYLSYLASLDTDRSGKEVLLLLRRALPKRLDNQIAALRPYTREIGESVRHYYGRERPRLRERYLSLLYVIGLYHWQNNPHLTLSLWTLAKEVLPDFGAIHIEIARLYQHGMHDDAGAQEVLQKCVTYKSARKQCIDFMNKELLPPGDFYDALY